MLSQLVWKENYWIMENYPAITFRYKSRNRKENYWIMENYPAITFRYKSRNMEKKLLDNGKLSSNNIPLQIA